MDTLFIIHLMIVLKKINFLFVHVFHSGLIYWYYFCFSGGVSSFYVGRKHQNKLKKIQINHLHLEAISTDSMT